MNTMTLLLYLNGQKRRLSQLIYTQGYGGFPFVVISFFYPSNTCILACLFNAYVSWLWEGRGVLNEKVHVERRDKTVYTKSWLSFSWKIYLSLSTKHYNKYMFFNVNMEK